MKKLTLIALATLSLNAYEIKFNKSFEKSIEPNILSTEVSIESEKQKEIEVKKDLDSFGDFFKNLPKLKLKHARMSINPKYAYEKDKARCIGYYGTLSYEVKAKNAKDMNDFIANFLRFKEKVNPKIKTNLSHIQWEIGKSRYQNAVGTLRIKALLWGKSYAKELSKTLKNKCSLKQAIFNDSPIYQARNNVMAYNSKKFGSATNTYLIKSKEAININPNFVFECK